MIELPEAVNLAGQLSTAVSGKRVKSAAAVRTSNKLVWYYGQPSQYSELLVGRVIGESHEYGGLVEIKAGNVNILFGDGVNLRLHERGVPRPPHLLLIEFEDGSAVSAAIRMYGGLGAFCEGELDNPYYRAAREKPSPLSEEFNEAYFERIISLQNIQNLSLKALLATEQRIPGLGNGVLQDILFNAKMHPKKKTGSLSAGDKEILFRSVKVTLSTMASRGGRDTEIDIFGKPGGYKTILSKNTVNGPCPVCGTKISKGSYLGGSIYYCGKCQLL